MSELWFDRNRSIVVTAPLMADSVGIQILAYDDTYKIVLYNSLVRITIELLPLLMLSVLIRSIIA